MSPTTTDLSPFFFKSKFEFQLHLQLEFLAHPQFQFLAHP